MTKSFIEELEEISPQEIGILLCSFLNVPKDNKPKVFNNSVGMINAMQNLHLYNNLKKDYHDWLTKTLKSKRSIGSAYYYYSKHFEYSEPEYIELVKIFLEAGADLDACDILGSNALAYAVTNSCTEIAKLLIKNGSKLSNTIEWLQSKVETLESSGVVEIIRTNDLELILLYMDTHGTDWINDHNMFHTVCQFCDEIIIETLIARGANIELRDQFGKTPIFYANERNFKLLLKRGADINAKDNMGNNILYFKRYEGYKLVSKIDYWIECGLDVSGNIINGERGIIDTVYSHYLGLFKMLVNSGCVLVPKNEICGKFVKWYSKSWLIDISKGISAFIIRRCIK